MFGVDGHDLARLGGLEHQRAARDQRFLVREGETGAGRERRQRGLQAQRAHQGVEHDVGLGVLDQPGDGVRPGVGDVADLGGSGVVGDGDVRHACLGALLGQQAGIAAAGRQPDDLEAVRVGGDDVQRLGADRAGAAEDQHSQSVSVLTDLLCRVARPRASALRGQTESDANVTRADPRPSVIGPHAEYPVSMPEGGHRGPSATREQSTMKIVYRKAFTAASLAAIAVLSLSACSNDSLHQRVAGDHESTVAAASAAPAPMERSMDPAANLVGPGCADYAAQNPTGPGSVTGMAQDPVAVAASNNPLLTTLTSAVSGKLNPNVNLVDTLNGSEFTVFAPTDAAFAKIDPATIESSRPTRIC